MAGPDVTEPSVHRVSPHRYSPDYMAMGDCKHCGHVADDPLHADPGARPEGERVAGSLLAPTGEQLRVWVPGRPPTPNARRHWAVRAKQDKLWKETGMMLGRDAANRQGWRAPDRARLTMHFVFPTRGPRDIDNAVAAQKPVVDGLVRARVLRADDADHLSYGAPEVTYQKGLDGTWLILDAMAGGLGL